MENWLAKTDVPLFVSHRRLARRKRLPLALGPWALDSGGFSELAMYGEWRTGKREYIDAVDRYAETIGHLQWAAPMDWMCEPFMVEKTGDAGVLIKGLTVAIHQQRTVDNYVDLRSSSDLHFIPVLQGWTLSDYEHCLELYAAAGVRLQAEPLVGVGSICRRQGSDEIQRILVMLHDEGLRLHGFGVKRTGLPRHSPFLTSADSMAWSYSARRAGKRRGCSHSSCANCLDYALAWREKTIIEQGAFDLEAAA